MSAAGPGMCNNVYVDGEARERLEQLDMVRIHSSNCHLFTYHVFMSNTRGNIGC
jgi:hypothetical protein